MKHSGFVHLHNHTQYSLLDGACRLDDILSLAHEFKMPALAITDHGNMFGAIEFYDKAMKQGIKPIIGYEAYVAPGNRKERALHGIKEAAFHLTLLAADEDGYKNLMKLATIAYLEGFYYKPRIDKQVLSEHSKGIIGLSGCMKSEISHLILSDQLEAAEKLISEYQDIFGKGNFYLELHNHGIEGQSKICRELISFGKTLNIPTVATNDCHYMKKHDALSHEALLCIQTGTTMDDPKRMRFSVEEFYFKSPDEMKQLFNETPEAILNTIEIAEKCNLELDFSKKYLPHFKVPKETSPHSYLEKLAKEGCKKRFQDVTKEITDRLEYELGVINKMNYASYFLIVWDFIQYAKGKGIAVGPGRGSAAGSLAAYCLDITNIDPLKYGLIFERFLNPDRISLPDIDIDFCYERRGEVIEYVVKKYGRENVAQIATFGTMAARAVIRDVGRVLGVPYAEVDKLAKMIPSGPNISLKSAIETQKEIPELIEKNEQVKTLIDIAKSLEGLARHVSTHAAGVVISEGSLTDFTPLFKSNKADISTQYGMNSLEKVGLLKMDFLGLKTLTVIQNAIALIEQHYDKKIETDKLPLDDKKTFSSLVSKGKTIGVFQLESSGMRDLSRKLRPESFNDLIPLVSLFRPGPMQGGGLDAFVKGRHSKSPIKYDHPILEPILKETYGVILYQEQVIKIANELAGFSMSEADTLRRIMGKKGIMDDKQRNAFISGAVKKGVKEKIASKIFDLIAYFAGYGFNKSHSAAYAMISFQTAYFKANYPVAFMTALLNSELQNTDKIVLYISECKDMGIDVLQPDINKSYAKFTIEGKNIRFGLAAIKNVGEAALNSIIKIRQDRGNFKSLYDFCERVDLRTANKRVIESLIKAGTFNFDRSRAQIMHTLDHAIKVGQQIQKDTQRGQTLFFDVFESQKEFREDVHKFADVEEWSESKLLAYEKEVLGFYVSGHPLAKHENTIKSFTTASDVLISKHQDGEEIYIGGIINIVKKLLTRKDKKRMCAFTLEDMQGTIEVLVYPPVFEKFYNLIEIDKLLLVKGRLDLRDDQPKIIASDIIPLSEAEEKLTKAIHLKLISTGLDEQTLQKLKDLLAQYPGKSIVYLHVLIPQSGEVTMLADPKIHVSPKKDLLVKLRRLIGQEAVSLSL
ncbi:DNA polymerase III subunit alpha [bacterium]|nr:DNA polymerase III subunit alpha [bacterium]